MFCTALLSDVLCSLSLFKLKTGGHIIKPESSTAKSQNSSQNSL